MKATGIVRRIDDLGRVVIPKEVRNTFELAAGDAVEIFTDGERIMLKKYAPGCALCNSLVELHTIEGKQVCMECRIKFGRTTGR